METAMGTQQRQGVLVKPNNRLSAEQVRLIDSASRELLEDPGLFCFSGRATEIFRQTGCRIEEMKDGHRIRIPGRLVDEALASAPSRIVLGAREPANRLILDAEEPRARFGSGSETNIWLDVRYENGTPHYTRRPGSIEYLCRAAHLCEHLEHLDFFIRCVNIQDEAINARNKDVNKFFHSLNHTTKHVQAGLTDLRALEDISRLGEIVAGGKEAFHINPVLSFIACVIKSPLQVVKDTAEAFIEITERRIPIVVSSCPMGGATGPFDEFGMLALINAELLAGVTLHQLVSPGAPVLYGAVPVRTRLDNLNDMYAAPEFVHYNMDCAQMARFYRLPCYSTAGVGDTELPGIQATAEKLFTYATIPWAGAQYIHYAFGLLERTNTFCPEQAILDDAHIGLVKELFKSDNVSSPRKAQILAMIREVMDSDHRTFVYHLPCPTREPVYVRYPLEDPEGDALMAAHRRYQEILQQPARTLPEETREEIMAQVPGILPRDPNRF